MSNKDFKIKLEKLNNELLAKELQELYLTDPDKAYSLYRIELANKIARDNKSLFERLSKL